MTRRADVLAAVERVQALPYVWPSEPTAASARRLGRGSCASKHALLAEELAELGVPSRPLFVVGALVPALLASERELAPGAALVEVHELLTVSVPGVGPCRVDVTWDTPLVAHGLPGTLRWDGMSDMEVAVGEALSFHAPDPARLRDEKEALRRRVYRGGERGLRDRTLAALSKRLERLRCG